MAQAHKFRKGYSLFSTTLSAGISTGTSETITPNSVTGLPTDTEITLTIDRVDSSGTATPTKTERITGLISAGNLTSYTRGVDGTTEQAHSSGAVVEYIWNADDLNDLIDGILVDHEQDGSHEMTSPEITTGINDANDNEMIKFSPTASAVNEFTVTNAATGNAPELSVTGGDTNIDLKLKGKGTGNVQAYDNSTSTYFNVLPPYNSLFLQAILNGNMDVWQRGTSIALTAADGYTADRWYVETATAGTDKTVSREDGTGVAGSYYCARVKFVSDVDELLTFSQALESQDSIKFRGKKVTLSFYARGGAEFVADNATLVSKIVTGKGTDQKVLAFTTSADGVSQDNTLTTDWQKFTCTTTAAIAADITQIGVSFAFTHAGSGTTSNYFEITQVQLCAGDVALPFQPKSYEEELRSCHRYFRRLRNDTGAYYTFGVGINISTTALRCVVSTPTPMRITPTILSSGNFGVINGTYASIGTSADWFGSGELGIPIALTGGTSAVSNYIRANNDATAQIDLSSEL